MDPALPPPTMDLSEYSPGDNISSVRFDVPATTRATHTNVQPSVQTTMSAYKLVSGDLSSHLVSVKVDKEYQTNPYETQPPKSQWGDYFNTAAVFLFGLLSGVIFNVLAFFWVLFMESSQHRASFASGLVLGTVAQVLLIVLYRSS